ncbi:MAG: ABC transporter permease [Candidatus Binatia bacterium]
MAWRDSRSSRRRLLCSITSITLGIAALVSISSFGDNIERSIHVQSKALLGADLVIKSRRPFGKETLELIRSLGGEQSRQVNFSSMVYFPKSGSTRLARVRALDGDFPYYGAIETVPESASRNFRKRGLNALVDDNLMLQYDAQIGDPIAIGALTFRIAGRLKKMPGETLAAGLIRPRVYIPLASLGQTKLIRKGSIARYRVYFKFDPERDTEELRKTHQPHFRKYRLGVDTVQERKERLGKIFGNLSHFLNLAGFIALLLGGVGVASGIHVYTKQKIGTVALLRCVGAKAGQTFAVYLIQAAAMGLGGVCLGILIGMGVQVFLPIILSDFLPINITVFISWKAIILGASIGLGIALLFALLPLISLRKISPLLTLRSSLEDTNSKKDPIRWFIYFLIAVAIGLFALAQTRVWYHGLIFAAGLCVAFGFLTGMGKLLMNLARNYFSNSWSYVWRQGLANLYRPNNQTVVVMLAIGLGTFFMITVQLSRDMLLEQVSVASGENNPNLVLFDIQEDQREDLRGLLETFDLRVLQETPIVTMRLAAIKGRSVHELREDPNSVISRWALRREYRSTYRSHLTDTETIFAGTWQGKMNRQSDRIGVSLEKEIAKDLDVTLGDELVFDIHGVPFTTRVGSIREVNWQRMQPNFFVVFPTGVLEDAPQFYVLVTRAPSNEISAKLQRTVVQRFPNVSTIDLTLILNTVNSVLSRVAFAISFITLFIMLTGLLVLAGAVMSSRYQHLGESALLRTLGASRAQIIKILLIEYLFLGSFAALTGVLLAVAACWALAYFLFEAVFFPAAPLLLVGLLVVIGITILIGMLNSRGICDRPPLEVLRSDV